jgi:hypothetical protein
VSKRGGLTHRRANEKTVSKSSYHFVCTKSSMFPNECVNIATFCPICISKYSVYVMVHTKWELDFEAVFIGSLCVRPPLLLTQIFFLTTSLCPTLAWEDCKFFQVATAKFQRVPSGSLKGFQCRFLHLLEKNEEFPYINSFDSELADPL